MTNNIGLTFSVGDTKYHSLQIVLSKTMRIGDTKYETKVRSCIAMPLNCYNIVGGCQRN